MESSRKREKINFINLWESYKYEMITFLLAFIPRLILCINNTPLTAFPDELATVAAGAYYAGLDWSEVLMQTRYYGTGFTAIFSILFKLTENPFVIYAGMMIICALIQAIPALICFKIVYSYFNIRDKKYVTIISLISSYMVVFTVIFVYNEHPMILITWILAYIICKLNEIVVQGSGKKLKIWTLILSLVLAYSLSLHTRAVVYYLGIIVLVAIYYYVHRKWLISLPVFAGGGILGYIIGKRYVNWTLETIWLTNLVPMDSNVTHNSTISITEDILAFFDPKKWPAIFNTIMGPANCIAIYTGGIFILCTVLLVTLCWKYVKRDKGLIEEGISSIYNKINILGVYFGSCIIVTLAGQVLIWAYNASAQMNAYGNVKYTYFLKSFTYLRYFGIYCGPILMLGCIFILNNRQTLVKYFKIAFGALLLIGVYWLVGILPYIYRTQVTNEYFVPFSLSSYGSYGDEMGLMTYLPASIIVIVLFGLFCWLYRKQRIKCLFVTLLLLLFYQYAYNSIFYQVDGYGSFDTSYNLIKNVDVERDLIDKVYVPNEMQYCEAQFLLNRYSIHPYIPEQKIEEGILIVESYSSVDEQIYDLGEYKCAELDNNEFLFVKGKKLQKRFLNEGIKLVDYDPTIYNVTLNQSDLNEGLKYSEYIHSFDRKGTLAEATISNLTQGTYELNISMVLNDFFDFNEIGEVIVLDSLNECVFKKQLLKTDFEDGKYSICQNVSVRDKENLQVIVYTYPDVGVVCDSFSYRKCSNIYKLSEDREKSIENILLCLSSLEKKLPVVFFDSDENHIYDFDFLEMSQTGIEFSATSSIEVAQEMKGCIILPYTSGDFFEFSKNHKILYKDKYYVAFIREDILAEDAGHLDYFENGYVNLDFFVLNHKENMTALDKTYTMPAGKYYCRFKIEDGIDLKESIICVETIENTERIFVEIEDNQGEVSFSLKNESVVKIYMLTSENVSVNIENIWITSFLNPEVDIINFIQNCYNFLLNRPADENGLYSWEKKYVNSGLNKKEIIISFIQSEEYQNLEYDERQFVESVAKLFHGEGILKNKQKLETIQSISLELQANEIDFMQALELVMNL